MATKKKAKAKKPPKFSGKLSVVDVVVTRVVTIKRLITLTKKTDPKSIAKMLREDASFDEADGGWLGATEDIKVVVSKVKAATKKDVERFEDEANEDGPYGSNNFDGEVQAAYDKAEVSSPGRTSDAVFVNVLPLVGLEPMPEPEPAVDLDPKPAVPDDDGLTSR